MCERCGVPLEFTDDGYLIYHTDGCPPIANEVDSVGASHAIKGPVKKPKRTTAISRFGKFRKRMVPRLVDVEFYKAVSGEPLGYTVKARPGSRVGALLPGLCAATGRPIAETALVFGGRRLSNKATLAHSGIRGTARVGVVDVPPSYTCPSCGKTTTIEDMREDLDDIREHIFWCADKLGRSSEKDYDYEKEPGMVPPPETLSNSEVFDWWCDEHYKMLDPELGLACPKCEY